jgi:hypothetical protein
VSPFAGDGDLESYGARSVSKRIQILVAVVALAVIGFSLGLLAILRVREAREFSRPHRVETYGGTNYILQLTETAVGKTETACVLIVYLRLQNPNPYDLTLSRNWFVLVDHGQGLLPAVNDGHANGIDQTARQWCPRPGDAQFHRPRRRLRGHCGARWSGWNYLGAGERSAPVRGALCATGSSGRSDRSRW